MAELDFSLPGLQARFLLEILRRRRWLIVPLALLGLGVGALVSFLIPRYYRAETRVEIKDISLEGRPVPKQGEDPMAGIVENARYTLASPRMILKAARALKWPEFFSADPEDPALRARIKAVLARLQVYPIRSGGTPGAGGILGISYADKDPKRAAEMANTLRDLWLEDRFHSLQRSLQSVLDKERGQEMDAREKWHAALNELRDFERANRLDPMMSLPGKENSPGIYKARDLLAEQIRKEEADLRGLEVKLAALQKEYESLPPFLREAQVGGGAGSDQNLAALEAAILRLRQRLSLMKESHPRRKAYEEQLRMLEEQRKSLLAAKGVLSSREVPNPLKKAKKEEIDRLKLQIGENRKRLEVMRKQLSALDRQCELFPKLHEEHVRRVQAEKSARQRLEEIQALVAKQERRLELFNSRQYYEVNQEAWPPPSPNDPSNLVIVLIGLAVGIGTAVGLILLTEILRISFRTVEEAERDLPVPVLGAAGYLETEEERLQARRRRRWVLGVLLGLFLLLGAVIGLYFLDPTRLPAFLTDFLDGILKTSPAG